MTWWNAILAWFSNMLGQRSGKAEQRQADQTAGLQQQVEVEHAETQAMASAPVDRDGVARQLRSGRF
jgi:hypothetical protein